MARKQFATAAAILILICLCRVSYAAAEQPVSLHYYVTDDVGVLTLSDTRDIEGLIFQIENDTSAQVAVFVVNNTSPLTIEQFAVQTFEKSQLGQEGVDNGLLLVVSVSDHHWKIEVGYGLEGVLNDAKVGRIGRTYLDPAFQGGEYGDGIYNAVYAMGVEIENSPSSRPSNFPIPGVPLNSWQLTIAIIVFIFLAIVTRGGIFLFVFGMFRRGGGGRSGGGGAGGKW